MKKTSLFLLTAIWLFTGCQSDEPREANEVAEDLSIAFQCEPIIGDTGDTRYGVYAVIRDYKMKLAETKPCEAISPDRFAELQMPPDALAAVGGNGDYFYAERESGQLLIYRRNQEVADTVVSEFHLIATFQDGHFNFIE